MSSSKRLMVTLAVCKVRQKIKNVFNNCDPPILVHNTIITVTIKTKMYIVQTVTIFIRYYFILTRWAASSYNL